MLRPPAIWAPSCTEPPMLVMMLSPAPLSTLTIDALHIARPGSNLDAVPASPRLLQTSWDSIAHCLRRSYNRLQEIALDADHAAALLPSSAAGSAVIRLSGGRRRAPGRRRCRQPPACRGAVYAR